VYTPSAAGRLSGEEPTIPRIIAMGDGAYFRWLAAQGTLSPRRLSRLSAVINAYKDVNCHALSVAGQRARGVDTDITWTFGESPLFVAHDLLQRAQAQRGDVFVDVGSACGRVVLGMQARYAEPMIMPSGGSVGRPGSLGGIGTGVDLGGPDGGVSEP
jgi:hypothetical protein